MPRRQRLADPQRQGTPSLPGAGTGGADGGGDIGSGCAHCLRRDTREVRVGQIPAQVPTDHFGHIFVRRVVEGHDMVETARPNECAVQFLDVVSCCHHDHTLVRVKLVQKIQKPGYDKVCVGAVVVLWPRPIAKTVQLIDEQNRRSLLNGTGKGRAYGLDDVRAARTFR